MAGRLLCVGFTGTEASPELTRALESVGPGALVLFARNVISREQTRRMVDALRSALGPVLVATDQEGGRVMRLGREAAPVPAMMALGASDDPEVAEAVGRALGADLRHFGVDVDFAPVLDLALEPNSRLVGNRAFGDDPTRVASLGAAVVRGLERAGVAATLKHFPGHGATELDSHHELPVVAASAATIRARELVPFRAGIAAGARCVMTAHVFVPALDCVRPATVSHAIVTGLLREELGFEGLCVTDCLEMRAVAANGGSAATAVAAIEAGADLLIVSHTPAVAHSIRIAIAAALECGTLAQARVMEAIARGDALRRHLTHATQERDVDGRAIALEAARRAITCVRGDKRLGGERPVTLVSFEEPLSDGVGSRSAPASLNLALRVRGVRSELLRVRLEPQPDAISELMALLESQRERDLVVSMRRAHLYAAQRAAIEGILAKFPDVALLSMLEPFDVASFPQARNVWCSYGDGEAECEALAAVLCGHVRATGKIPVRVGGAR